jgi:hypothetical protein
LAQAAGNYDTVEFYNTAVAIVAGCTAEPVQIIDRETIL